MILENEKDYQMIISDIQARKFLLSLYTVAEKDTNDINAASTLAVRFETPKREYSISELEARIIGYSNNKFALVTEQPEGPRRKTYKRRVSLA
jgi:hypothetical protein